MGRPPLGRRRSSALSLLLGALDKPDHDHNRDVHHHQDEHAGAGAGAHASVVDSVLEDVALVLKDGYAEIKRMFVRDDARGAGIAAGILQSLEEVAVAHGVDTLQLETGPLQPAAIGFYVRHGFSRIPLFGEYVGSEHSVCFAKRLLP